MRTIVYSWQHTVIMFFIMLFLSITVWSPSAIAIPSGTHIPVIINIHKDAGISKGDAKKAVEEASKILKQAGIKLSVVDVNENASDGDTGNDGVIDFGAEEWKKMIKAGKDEIETKPNKKGIKISFVKTPEKGSSTPGWAVHREPVTVVQNRGSAQLTGQTIAHEIGHIFTLGKGHKIDDSTTANNGGHAPDTDGQSGKENLMAPSDYRTGTHLTKAQIDEIKTQTDPFSSSSLKGKCSAQFEAAYPAKKVKHQHGAKTDALNDNSAGGSTYTDLFSISLGSSADSNKIHGELSLGSLFSGDVDVIYSLAFNSDNDVTSGYKYQGFEGMEYALEMSVNGTDGNYSASGLVLNLANNTTVELPDPFVETGHIFNDLNEDAIAGLSQLLFDVEKSYVGLDTTTANKVNIGILAQDSSNIFDIDSVIFDLYKWLDDPILQTFGNGIPTPGGLYDFAVSGLLPNSDFNLFLDEDLVFSGALDSSGSCTDSFIFPDYLPNDTFYFLTAQDNTGEFAYSITCPTPEPSTLLLLIIGLIGTIGIKKKSS